MAVKLANGREQTRRRWLRSLLRPWASVTKLLTGLAALVAVEEGIVDLDEPAGPPGSTLRHLLSHASGLPLNDAARMRWEAFDENQVGLLEFQCRRYTSPYSLRSAHSIL